MFIFEGNGFFLAFENLSKNFYLNVVNGKESSFDGSGSKSASIVKIPAISVLDQFVKSYSSDENEKLSIVLIKDFNQSLETIVKCKPEAAKDGVFKNHPLFLDHFLTIFKLKLEDSIPLSEEEINVMCALTHSGPDRFVHNSIVSSIDFKFQSRPQFIAPGIIITQGYLNYLDACSVD
jgi:hypothetical protein